MPIPITEVIVIYPASKGLRILHGWVNESVKCLKLKLKWDLGQIGPDSRGLL